MRMLRTPPFFPPKSGEKPYLEIYPRLVVSFRKSELAKAHLGKRVCKLTLTRLVAGSSMTNKKVGEQLSG